MVSPDSPISAAARPTVRPDFARGCPVALRIFFVNVPFGVLAAFGVGAGLALAALLIAIAALRSGTRRPASGIPAAQAEAWTAPS